MTTLDRLIATRKLYTKRLTELYNFADAAARDTTKHSEFKIRYENIEEIRAKFEEYHHDIITSGQLTDQQLNDHDEIRSTFDDEYFSTKTIYINLFPDALKGTFSPVQNQSLANFGVLPNSRLPKINIPIFTGNLRQWPSFIDIFNSIVHSNVSLSDVEKYQYLQSYLIDEPLNLVKGIPLIGTNYQIAYDTLVKRYQNKRLLATNYWQQIYNLPKIKSDSPENLRQLIDTYAENIAALKSLGFPVDQWDFILFNMLLQKLDANTAKRFEFEHSTFEIPSINDLVSFLSKHCKALEALSHIRSDSNVLPKNKHKLEFKSPKAFFTKDSSEESRNRCPLCKDNHSIYKCSQFVNKTPKERYILVKTHTICVNCLSKAHSFNSCKSLARCKKCDMKHHTLLHFEKSAEGLSESKNTSQGQNTPSTSYVPHSVENTTSISNISLHSSTRNFHSIQFPTESTVLLPTAIVRVSDIYGSPKPVRVLLDSGSQINVISEACFRQLGLTRYNHNFPIQGLNGMSRVTAKGKTSFLIHFPGSSQRHECIEAIILPKICTVLPTCTYNKGDWRHLQGLNYADPNYNVSGPIDILLGASIFPLICGPGRVIGRSNEPMAMETVFGWVLMGTVPSNLPALTHSFFSMDDSLSSLDHTLTRFWSLEDIPHATSISEEDAQCEQFFINTHRRDSQGHFVVSLPFKNGEPLFSDSRGIALRRFYALERKLLANPNLYKSYSGVMQEYLNLEHMEKIHHHSAATSAPTKTYYLPHHAVLKPESVTTKLRVVFDASARTPEGSLNDFLLLGPKLQKDIFNILLNFRRHRIVFTSDIEAMYRQIWVCPEHRDYQRVLWRFSPHDSVQDYRLCTVTFGVSSSPFLALRTIQQLVQDEKSNFPLAAEHLSSNLYVDDCITGCDSLEESLKIKTQLIAVLEKGGFKLRKWASNHPEFINSISPSLQQNPVSMDDTNFFLKVLGLQWCPTQDVFSYQVQCKSSECTKRNILSEIARIYDPLGFLTPLTFFAKRLMQVLWTKGVNWDDPPPDDIVSQWNHYKNEFHCLSDIKIPRRFLVDSLSLEIHGFGDASELGYGACIYFRAIDSSHNIYTHLVCAKSKVAPLKRICLPRLELCAAVLVADLLNLVLATLKGVTFHAVYAWSDSTITLAWIKSSPHKFKTFVANRVSRIQDKIAPQHWRHVPSRQNPADVASRGLFPSQLVKHEIWWNGPTFLKDSHEVWPSTTADDSASENGIFLEETKSLVLASLIDDSDPFLSLLRKHSSLQKILRIISYCSRFLSQLRRKANKCSAFTENELHETLLVLVRLVQGVAFSTEIALLSKGLPCSKSLRKLSPFLDSAGVLRVGGRLMQAQIPYEQKHPALLPRDHRLTDLIISDYHNKYLHPGQHTLHYLIAQNFWILSAKRAIRRCVSSCIKCFRANPSPVQPPMGVLPPCRISEVKPFLCSGVDFAGPFNITLGKHRGAKTHKAYLCVFVCCSTKALHLELATDLSMEAFLAALRRFIARRGRCNELHSDCGTNFIASAKYLNQLMAEAVGSERINWKFNPPSAPHFGGLWEAGVKSVKSHLIRLIGHQILTYEELNTVFIQIEAVLNSRPLCALSPDPHDYSCLTPGHFLTLAPLSTLPDHDVTSLKIGRLNRWQLLTQLHQHFWKRWSNEYLHDLTQKTKWTHGNVNLITPGTLVVIKDDNQPPLRWRLGRIQECHAGPDKVIRVATVRTATGVFKRPLVKLCPLPLG